MDKFQFTEKNQNENDFVLRHAQHHHWRVEIPNLIDDTIKCPYALRLYLKYKRIAGDGGECWVKNSDLAEQCGMSERKLREAKKYLSTPNPVFGNQPLIYIKKRRNEKGQLKSDVISINEIWVENAYYYSHREMKKKIQKKFPTAPHAAGCTMEPAAPHAAGPAAPGAEHKKKQTNKKNNIETTTAEKNVMKVSDVVVGDIFSDSEEKAQDEHLPPKLEGETLSYTNGHGERKTITKSEIYSHFLSLPYSTEVVGEAIKRLQKMDRQFSMVLKYLEGICQKIENEKRPCAKRPKKDKDRSHDTTCSDPKSNKTKKDKDRGPVRCTILQLPAFLQASFS